MSSPSELPSGTVTFLFTDIEGSTDLHKRLGDRYAAVLDDHRLLLREAFAGHVGREIDTQGDSFFFAFSRAKHAIAAAIDGQRSLAAHAWPEGVELRVRMGLHSGEPLVGDERYVGIGVNRAARIGAAAHGGQVLLSDATRALVEDDLHAGVSLRDLGRFQLKDIDRQERISQLIADGLRLGFRRCGRDSAAGVSTGGWSQPPWCSWLGRLRPCVLLTRWSSGSAHASTGVAADSVGVFNARSGNRIAEAGVRPGPSAIAVGADAVWVANVDDDSVSRLDPKTNASVDTIDVGKGPTGIAVGGGFVWVANGLDGTVSKIDPNTNTPVQTISVGNGPSGVAFGEGAVWVANSTDRTVTRIDPRTGKPGREIPAPAGADANNLDGTVSRIDPATNRQTSVLTVGDGPSGVAVTPDGKTVWVSSEIAAPCRRSSPTGWPPLPTALRGRR